MPIIIAETILSGLFDKFPKLRFISVEAGAGWVPYFLEQMDDRYFRNRGWAKVELEMLPSEYFQRNWLLTFVTDFYGVAQPPRRRAQEHDVVDRLPAPHLRLAVLAQAGERNVRRRAGKRAPADLRRQRARRSTSCRRPNAHPRPPPWLELATGRESISEEGQGGASLGRRRRTHRIEDGMQTLDEVFGGHFMSEVRDPYRAYARLRRDEPVKLLDLPLAPGYMVTPLRRRGHRAQGRHAVLVARQRQGHRAGDGTHHPRDGRQGAHAAPQHRLDGVRAEGAAGRVAGGRSTAWRTR